MSDCEKQQQRVDEAYGAVHAAVDLLFWARVRNQKLQRRAKKNGRADQAARYGAVSALAQDALRTLGPAQTSLYVLASAEARAEFEDDDAPF